MLTPQAQPFFCLSSPASIPVRASKHSLKTARFEFGLEEENREAREGSTWVGRLEASGGCEAQGVRGHRAAFSGVLPREQGLGGCRGEENLCL